MTRGMAMPHHSDGDAFRAITCRGVVIPTRVVFVPINPGFARNGVPTAKLVRFHRTRSGHSIGISLVGNVATALDTRTNVSTSVLTASRDLPRFKVIARAIRDNGSVAGIQIADCPAWLAPDRTWRATDAQAELARLSDCLLSIDSTVLRHTLQLFEISAQLAIDSGFDLIEIHAAHGYTLSLLLDPMINKRQDAFGPKAPWLEELCLGLRKRLGDRLLAVRVSALKGLSDRATELDAAVALATRLESCGVDVVDLSAGLYSIDRSLIYPTFKGLPSYLDIGFAVAHRVGVLVVCTGGIRPSDLAKPLPRNALLGLGRALLADPQCIGKWRAGQESTIVPCCGTGKCHFFTRGVVSIECGQNSLLRTRGE